jgi:N-acetylglucosaminyldiphosphoundecaprenol N-acetyl-beta-D-mannosaminyltransferase
MTMGQSQHNLPSRAPIAILGVPFDNVTTAETLEIIAGMVASGKPHYGATANVDFVAQALEDVELRRILFDAHLVLADGMPLVWASKFLGNPLPERVTGSGMIPMLLELAEQRGWKVFFLGGTEQSVATAAEKTRAKHPRLKLVGAYSPPFKPLLEMDHADILRRLHEARPDILLVAFGCPKQEKWIAMNYAAAGVPFSVGVGATIDFLAGTFKRAPVWMQKTGLEWIFRMLQEPGRLVKRYAKDMRIFGVAILKQWWQMRGRERPASGDEATVTSDIPGVAIIKVPVRLDAASAQAQQGLWQQAVAQADVIVDMAAAEFVDSTGVGVLIRLCKQAREVKRGFVLTCLQPTVETALRMMKLEKFFSIEASVVAARVRMLSERTASQVGVRAEQEVIVLSWRGDITATTAPEICLATLEQLKAVPDGAGVVVDLANVNFVDSTGIGMMVKLKKRLWQRGVKLIYRAPTDTVRNVLRMTKLESYLLDTNQ